MIPRNGLRLWLAPVALVAVLVAGACSKDKSTNPPSGGGAKELDSPNLGSGAVYTDTFPTTAKTYPYHCKIHSSMTASVIVSSGGPAHVDVTISGFAFSPNPATIGPGGSVTWTNNDATTHTVTSD